MKRVFALIANGSEETECLVVVDLLKRAGIDVPLVSIHEEKEIISSHNIKIIADNCIKDVIFSDYDGIFIPGGMPGSEYISSNKVVINALKTADEENKIIAAICAAPGVVLGRHGLLKGRKATCYPGFEKELVNDTYVDVGVIKDGNIITSRGLGYALDLGLEIIKTLLGEEEAKRIKKQIQYDK